MSYHGEFDRMMREYGGMTEYICSSKKDGSFWDAQFAFSFFSSGHKDENSESESDEDELKDGKGISILQLFCMKKSWMQ